MDNELLNSYLVFLNQTNEKISTMLNDLDNIQDISYLANQQRKIFDKLFSHKSTDLESCKGDIVNIVAEFNNNLKKATDIKSKLKIDLDNSAKAKKAIKIYQSI